MPDRLHFSIVVPAHNEEAYLQSTLEHLAKLDYPIDRHEVIVVENGSTDGTYALAKRFENAVTRVLRSEKGVSRAKNAGIDAARADSDWFVFLDADTTLERGFLAELDAFLRQSKGLTVGTVTVRPYPDTSYARLWFAFYDLGHRLTKRSYAIHIVKRSLFPPLRFDEALLTSEDGDLTTRALRYGAFFLMRTRQASTSTRRFERLGWWHVFFNWTFVDRLPKRIRQRCSYESVR